VKSSTQVSCPHCQTRLQLAPEQREQAGGQVRCGNCLHVFDADSGELGFVAPPLPDERAVHPLAPFSTKMMDIDLLPAVAYSPSKFTLLLLAALLLSLAAQVFLWREQTNPVGSMLQIEKLVVRGHPDVESALRVDAILSNTGGRPAPMPALDISFSTRYGEARGRRLFMPAEYLHGDYGEMREIAANTQMQISLSLQNPGHDAINFDARLRSLMNPPD
jgi:predicted Zn finger-like uncharacterized protein